MSQRIYAWAAAALIAFAANAASASERAGEVVGVSGACYVEIAGQRSALKVQDPVNVGDTVIVSDGAKLQLRMLDGSVVTAAAGTRLTVSAYSFDQATNKRDASFSLWGGLLHALVSKVSQPSRFEVDTATAVAAVRSTDWLVETYSGRTEVGVITGHVFVTGNATGKGVEIIDGQGTVVQAGGSPSTPRAWDAKEFTRDLAKTKMN